MEDCETGFLTETRCGAKAGDQKLQGHCDVEVGARLVSFFVWKGKTNPRVGRNYTWEGVDGISCQHLQGSEDKSANTGNGRTERPC